MLSTRSLTCDGESFVDLRFQLYQLRPAQETSDHSDVVLATFETSARELLFPYPQLRGPYCAGVDVDLLMEPSQDFPGIISPKVNNQ